jgi:hypothetical protein
LTAIGGPHADGNPLSTFLLRARRLQNIEPVDWTHEEVSSWRDRQPGRAFEWRE